MLKVLSNYNLLEEIAIIIIFIIIQTVILYYGSNISSKTKLNKKFIATSILIACLYLILLNYSNYNLIYIISFIGTLAILKLSYKKKKTFEVIATTILYTIITILYVNFILEMNYIDTTKNFQNQSSVFSNNLHNAMTNTRMKNIVNEEIR